MPEPVAQTSKPVLLKQNPVLTGQSKRCRVASNSRASSRRQGKAPQPVI